VNGNSLIQFVVEQKDHAGQQLHWGRADEDGAPFRGERLMLTEDEYDSRVVRIKEAHNDTFNTADPASNRRYLRLLSKAAHGIVQILDIKKRRKRKGKNAVKPIVYVEWLEFYMQDGVTNA
jgi:hypothetical protein